MRTLLPGVLVLGATLAVAACQNPETRDAASSAETATAPYLTLNVEGMT